MPLVVSLPRFSAYTLPVLAEILQQARRRATETQMREVLPGPFPWSWRTPLRNPPWLGQVSLLMRRRLQDGGWRLGQPFYTAWRARGLLGTLRLPSQWPCCSAGIACLEVGAMGGIHLHYPTSFHQRNHMNMHHPVWTYLRAALESPECLVSLCFLCSKLERSFFIPCVRIIDEKL